MSAREAMYDGISISKLYDLEEKGRSLAYKREEEVSFEEDSNFLEELSLALYDINDVAFRSRHADVHKFSGEIRDTLNEADKDVYKCVMKSKKRSDCVIGEKVKNSLLKVDETSERIIGKKCTWLLGVKEPYNLSSFWNDITSCFHRLIEKVSEETKEIAGGEGRCGWTATADKSLINACKEWNKKIEEMRKKGLYTESDYKPLAGKIRGLRAEFVVGSSPGHRTHVDLEKGEVRYYDSDRSVNELMKDVLEETGLKCKLEDDGVECRGLTESNLSSAVERLAIATSADYRLANPDKFWPEQLLGKCRVDPKEVEKCLLRESGLIG